MPRDPHRDQPALQGGTPLADATAILLLLHGRGGSAQEMLALARDLNIGSPSPHGGEGARGSGEAKGRNLAWFAPEAAGRQWYPFSLLEKVEKNQGALNSALGLV